MASGVSTLALAYYALPLVAVLLHAGLGYWIYRSHWDRAGAKWFAITLVTGGLSAFCFWIYLLTPVEADFKRLLFFPVALFAFFSYVAFSVFAGRYTGTDFHRHWLARATMVAIVGGFVLLWAIEPLGLYISNLRLIEEPVPYHAYDIEVGLGVVYLLSYALGGYTVYRLVVYLLSTSARSTRQLALLIAAVLSVIGITAASQAGLFPAENLNHATYSTIPFTLFATLALFKFDLLNVQPVARNAVVENLRDPVLVLDDEHRVVDFNRVSTRIWSDLDAHVGEPFETACPSLADTVDVSDGDDQTRITMPADGRDRHYSVTVSEVTRGDRDGEWLSILLRDVTALERSRWQLENQNERLDQVASTVSHDLRNPINVADGYAEILTEMLDEDGIDASEADTASEYLDDIRTSHERMESIIADVLTIAREGKTVDETESVSLATAARDAWANVETRDATLTVDDDRTLQADRSKLLSILENCFRNAVEHGSTGNQNSSSSGNAVEHGSTSNRTESGDAVEHGPTGNRNVKRSDDSVDHSPADVAVEVGATDGGFYVADDGPGIPEEHADSVFEYGYTTTEEGTGLGLSIVETMAESHGWTVELETPVGGDETTGTRFVFTGVDGSIVGEREPHPAA